MCCRARPDRNEAGMWGRRMWGLHSHGLKLGPGKVASQVYKRLPVPPVCRGRHARGHCGGYAATTSLLPFHIAKQCESNDHLMQISIPACSAVHTLCRYWECEGWHASSPGTSCHGPWVSGEIIAMLQACKSVNTRILSCVGSDKPCYPCSD